MTGSSEHAEYPDRIYAYNLDNAATPGQMKIRWRIRVATGTEAEHLDIVQQQAILDLLTWSDSRKKQAGKSPEPAPENKL